MKPIRIFLLRLVEKSKQYVSAGLWPRSGRSSARGPVADLQGAAGTTFFARGSCRHPRRAATTGAGAHTLDNSAPFANASAKAAADYPLSRVSRLLRPPASSMEVGAHPVVEEFPNFCRLQHKLAQVTHCLRRSNAAPRVAATINFDEEWAGPTRYWPRAPHIVASSGQEQHSRLRAHALQTASQVLGTVNACSRVASEAAEAALLADQHLIAFYAELNKHYCHMRRLYVIAGLLELLRGGGEQVLASHCGRCHACMHYWLPKPYPSGSIH